MALTVQYPKSIVWVFNPVYMYLSDSDNASGVVKVYVGGRGINVSLFNGTAKVYISRLLQLAFTNPRIKRSERIKIQVNNLSPTYITAVWGSIEFGDRFGEFGAFNYNGRKGWHERHVQRFNKFPFTLDILQGSQGVVRYRKDSDTSYIKMHDITCPDIVTLLLNDIKADSILTVRQDYNASNETSVFDATFDYTFRTPDDTTVITHIHTRNEEEGFYLRWIDRFGFMQYYLFVPGTNTLNSSPSSTILNEDIDCNDIMMASTGRPFDVTTERTVKLCAVNLDEETLAYVSGIVSSPIIDLYIGRTKANSDGEYDEIWEPVSVANGSYTYESRKNNLQDFEITLKLPNRVTQSL